jgi:heptaprenyl diphosphate synthase
MSLVNVFLQMNDDIKIIEKEMKKVLSSIPHDLIYEASNHLLKAGGKRIRPMLLLLGGKFGNYNIDYLKYGGAAIELIHMASLIHDDVIDRSSMRRGQATVNKKWDNRIAMYVGDYLLAEGLETAGKIEIPKFHQIFSNALKEMCIGEIEQMKDLYNWEQNLRNYLRRIKRKTGLLIAVSCQLGAVTSGASELTINALYNYGYNLGMSFQVTDDILDFMGDEKTLGKPAGGDLKQGHMTLPTLLCYRNSTYHDKLKNLLELKTDASLESAIQLIRSSDAIELAQKAADNYISKSLYWLDKLPDIPEKKSLLEIAHFIGHRQF